MRYLVFDTQDAAKDAVELIDDKGRQCYRDYGFSIREDGAIIGTRDGEDDPSGVTMTWDVPRQGEDGHWLVTHPETQPMAGYAMPDGRMVLDIVMSGLEDVPIYQIN
jgi:hypothetical protein